jgi:hypothetical protein
MRRSDELGGGQVGRQRHDHEQRTVTTAHEPVDGIELRVRASLQAIDREEAGLIARRGDDGVEPLGLGA